MAFETARLTIRDLGVEDAGFVLALLNDPGFLGNIGDRGVRTIEQARAYIRDRAAVGGDDAIGMRLVVRTADDVGLGTIGFVRRDGLDRPDLGFAFMAEHCGQGYGGEAARALLDRTPALRPLLAVTAPHNAASARLLTRLGFVERAPIRLPGHDADSRLFRLD